MAGYFYLWNFNLSKVHWDQRNNTQILNKSKGKFAIMAHSFAFYTPQATIFYQVLAGFTIMEGGIKLVSISIMKMMPVHMKIKMKAAIM